MTEKEPKTLEELRAKIKSAAETCDYKTLRGLFKSIDYTNLSEEDRKNILLSQDNNGDTFFHKAARVNIGIDDKIDRKKTRTIAFLAYEALNAGIDDFDIENEKGEKPSQLVDSDRMKNILRINPAKGLVDQIKDAIGYEERDPMKYAISEFYELATEDAKKIRRARNIQSLTRQKFTGPYIRKILTIGLKDFQNRLSKARINNSELHITAEELKNNIEKSGIGRILESSDLNEKDFNEKNFIDMLKENGIDYKSNIEVKYQKLVYSIETQQVFGSGRTKLGIANKITQKTIKHTLGTAMLLYSAAIFPIDLTISLIIDIISSIVGRPLERTKKLSNKLSTNIKEHFNRHSDLMKPEIKESFKSIEKDLGKLIKNDIHNKETKSPLPNNNVNKDTKKTRNLI